MKWYSNLYLSNNIAHKADKIKWKINHNAGQVDIYVITLASNEKNLLDIIPSWELMQKYYPKENLYIIGIAKGYDEALLLVQKIIEEVYQKTGGFLIQSYFNVKKDSSNH